MIITRQVHRECDRVRPRGRQPGWKSSAPSRSRSRKPSAVYFTSAAKCRTVKVPSDDSLEPFRPRASAVDSVLACVELF
jgi:hypothetical protein